MICDKVSARRDTQGNKVATGTRKNVVKTGEMHFVQQSSSGMKQVCVTRHAQSPPPKLTNVGTTSIYNSFL